MRAVLAAVVFLVLLVSVGRADDVTMKDGKVHKDLTLVKENAKTLEFMTLDGKRITLSKDAIAEHEKKETARDVYGVRKKEVPAKDAAALFELAKFAKESGMTREARQDFEAVLRLDPNHAGAREGLGQKLLDGKWLSEADAKKVEAERAESEAKAQGLKKTKDGWVTPVELARMEKGLIKVGPEWVTKEQKKKIDDDKLEYFQGEWVTAADKQKFGADGTLNPYEAGGGSKEIHVMKDEPGMGPGDTTGGDTGTTTGGDTDDDLFKQMMGAGSTSTGAGDSTTSGATTGAKDDEDDLFKQMMNAGSTTGSTSTTTTSAAP